MKTNNLNESFLTIRKATHRNGKTFYSNSNFFNEEVIVNIDHEKIVITHIDIDTKSKAHKPTCVGSGYVTVVVCNLEYGKYKIDPEESNEDGLVIYYKEQEGFYCNDCGVELNSVKYCPVYVDCCNYNT